MLDGLASFVEKCLVQVEGRSAEEVRYRLLESVREYALEQLRLRNELEEARRISLIITTKGLGLFFRETGGPVMGALPLALSPLAIVEGPGLWGTAQAGKGRLVEDPL